MRYTPITNFELVSVRMRPRKEAKKEKVMSDAIVYAIKNNVQVELVFGDKILLIDPEKLTSSVKTI